MTSTTPEKKAKALAGARWGVALFTLALAMALMFVLSNLPQAAGVGGAGAGSAPGLAPVVPSNLLDRSAAGLLSLMGASALGLYAYLFLPRAFTTFRRMLLLGLVVVVWLMVAKLFLSVTLPDYGHRYLAFMLPMAAGPMLVAGLLDVGLGLVTTLVLGLLTAFVGFSRLEPGLSLQLPRDVLAMVTVFLVGGLTGVFAVKRAERSNRYLTAGASVALVTFVSLLAFWLLSGERRGVDLLWMFCAASLGGVLSAIVGMGSASIVGPVFGITTRMQLMALAQLNHPLLRRLQQEAPGTFHHSAIVGNLAERAADLIDADAVLVRAGCYFHDIGKLVKPSYYIENQTNGESPYDQLTPQASARLVIEHVSAGMELARKYGVPERVRAFIPEHHGTRLVTYFFRKAFGEDPGIDPEPFRYLGPKPQTRETAIVMLADSVEAVVRSSHDRSTARIEALVQAVIAERAAEGQLEQCELTLRDLKTIRDSFIATLRGVYHARIEYPDPSPGEESAVAAAMSAPPLLASPMEGMPEPGEEMTTRALTRTLSPRDVHTDIEEADKTLRQTLPAFERRK